MQNTNLNDKDVTLGKQIVKERENANYKFLQLIYKKMIGNEVDTKYADEIISDIEASLKRNLILIVFLQLFIRKSYLSWVHLKLFR